MSEDCLTINVLTPAAAGPHAVMVYFHAGEFHCGSSNDAESNLPQFAGDIVFVTFNYRVGPFGFLAADALRSRHPRNGTGNYGLLDQRFAIEWVRKNIAGFGGDPGRITLMGESSGGTSVAYHLTAGGRASTDLFHRAILQSPGLTQVKPFSKASQNFEWILAALTAKGSPGCRRGSGYVAFRADAVMTKFPVGVVIRVGINDTVAFAKRWCDTSQECAGFWRASNHVITYLSNATQFIYDVENVPGQGASVSYFKSGPTDSNEQMNCLLRADAVLMNSVTYLVPRDDTFQTDAWAPVIDGVDVREPITKSVARGDIAQGVDLLLGTNLDEGTEFMSLTPPLSCAANASALAAWASSFYGAAVGPHVLELYADNKLRRPLPACGPGGSPKDIPGEQATSYNAASRSAGDAAIRCPALRLAERAGGAAFVYLFAVTPNTSVNFGNTSVMGAFHGAEVPFVFGDDFELQPGHERQISAAMGCYWRSFAKHGDPSAEACSGDSGLSAAPALPVWRPFVSAGPVLQLGSTVELWEKDMQTKHRCGFFEAGSGLEGQRFPRAQRRFPEFWREPDGRAEGGNGSLNTTSSILIV